MKKAIKVQSNIAFDQAINAVLHEVEKRASVRCITPKDIYYSISKIEMRLNDLRIPKKEWKGLSFACDPHAQTFPSAYKGRPESTQFVVERKASAWHITEIKRNYTTTSSTWANGQTTRERLAQLINQYTKF